MIEQPPLSNKVVLMMRADEALMLCGQIAATVPLRDHPALRLFYQRVERETGRSPSAHYQLAQQAAAEENRNVSSNATAVGSPTNDKSHPAVSIPKHIKSRYVREQLTLMGGLRTRGPARMQTREGRCMVKGESLGK